jgi:hypothetical protein
MDKAQRQVNTSLTLHNLIIGYYIVEYEQSGKDRAVYGLRLLKAIAQKLIKIGVKNGPLKVFCIKEQVLV